MPRALPHVFMAAIILITLAACGEKPPAQHGGQMPPPPVGVANPLIESHPETRELTGRFEAVSYVELRPQVGGAITKILVNDGALVKAGQPLVEIDRAPFDAAVAQAQAQVARAEAMLAQAKQHHERATTLVANKVLSQQAFDDADSALASAQADLAAAKAALVVAELDVTYTTISAPIAGRIGRIQATAGNIAQGTGPAQGTLIATLVSSDPIYAVFDLDETTWHGVSDRLIASANGEAPVAVHAALTGDSDFSYAGSVSVVDNHIDSASGSIRIRATFANPNGALVPGAFARIRLETAPARDLVLVNEQAVMSQMNMRYVYTVDDAGATAMRPVTLGESIGPMRVVTSGLTADDRIAINNLSKIFYPGATVSPVPASMHTLQNASDAAKAQPAPSPAGESADKTAEHGADQ
jgi:RND family efflux transporter MFP subunit